MNHNVITKQNQTVNNDQLGVFGNFFFEFNVGSLLNTSGISKTRRARPLAIFTIIFNLAFIRKNFFQGIVRSKNIRIGKDAVYNFLNAQQFSWPSFRTFILNNENQSLE